MRSFPILNKGIKLVGEGIPTFPVRQEIHIQPRVPEGCLTNQENPRIDEARNHRLALINNPVPYPDPEVS